MIEQTKEQEAGIVALKKRIAALEGETKEQQVAKERLASNQTGEGRAINRRIDVIVRPASQPAQ